MPGHGSGVSCDGGVTLVELLTVVSLLSVVIAVAYLLLGSASAMSDQLEARAVATDENRAAIDGITRELRQAMEITDDGGVLLAAQPRQCEFYSDVDNDRAPELVKYRVQQGKLWRSVFEPTTQVAPFSFSATATSDKVIVSGLDGGWTGAIFAYYDRSNPPAAVLDAQRASVSAISLRLVSIATIGAATAHAELSTWVKIRSVHNSID